MEENQLINDIKDFELEGNHPVIVCHLKCKVCNNLFDNPVRVSCG